MVAKLEKYVVTICHAKSRIENLLEKVEKKPRIAMSFVLLFSYRMLILTRVNPIE